MSQFASYEDMENADYEPESNGKSGMSSLYNEMLRDGIPTDHMGRIYLSDGMVLNKDGIVEEE